jgi:uncharacterized membrane protein
LNLPLAVCLVVLAATITNRIIAMGIGLWFQVPAGLLFLMLLFIDVIQIPFFYRIYEHGSTLLDDVPLLRGLTRRGGMASSLSKWARHLGGIGVMLVAALPSFGGGMWSATFLAYGMGLKRRDGYAWLILGSALSYGILYFVLDTLIRTARYFIT